MTSRQVLADTGTSGRAELIRARDEFHLAAIVQNLKTVANYVWRPVPDKQAVANVT
jgi:hypothetical protein